MLADESINYLRQFVAARVAREKILVAQMMAAADHHEIHAHDLAFRRARDDVGVARDIAADELLFAHPPQGAHLVAENRRLLVILVFRGGVHARNQAFDRFVVLAAQEQFSASDVIGVVGGVDASHAGRSAASDLVQQAGPRTVFVHAVGAGTQAKDLLQELHAFAHGAGVRKRAEIAVARVEAATVKCQARECMPRQRQVRIGFVVPEKYVVARAERLDQVVFEDQRFGLGARHRGFERMHLAQHQADARRQPGLLLKIRRDAFFEIARLADVERLPRRAQHAVDAGQVRQVGDDFGRIEHAQRDCKYFEMSANTASNIAVVRRRVFVL